MLRSMYSAISGLRNHQTRMDVVGNNIANVNTVGFKKSRVTFQDILSQNIRGGAGPDQGRGGTNPQQVGLGMAIGSIDVIHTPGNLQSTGVMTDLAIEGDGFFMVGTDDGQTFYTRAGNFDIDRNGNVVNPDGMKVKGWMPDEIGGKIDDNAVNLDSLEGLRIPIGVESGARASTEITYNKNLDSRVALEENTYGDGTYDADGKFSVHPEYAVSIPMDFYDKNGRPYDIEVLMKPGEVINQWEYAVRARPAGSGQGDWVYANAAGEVQNDDIWGTMFFDDDGTLLHVGDEDTLPDEDDRKKNIELTNFDNAFGDLLVEDLEENLTLDFSDITQLAAPMSVQANTQDGFPSGTLESITVDSQGYILGVFSNGTTENLAKVALANFNNPSGLMSQGGNLYAVSNNSGNPQIGVAGTGGRGTIAPGSLEMSNVDLSEEFVDMITTQRGFQANSRIITTSDEMLQELVNLKR
ncbi:flagellar hook protein FlgE [Desulfitispora alkaliphila]|uniref:flagellar hook protein FlgE n=1 Tax=Desulfitispora alkaliphila TaxID=622674 RepID=UPI003D206906